MNNLSSILNWIGNTIGNTALGTAATTIKGAIAELNTRTSKAVGTPQVYTDGVGNIVWEETSLTKYDGIVECKLRFTVVSSAALPAGKKMFEFPVGFRPINVIRPIVSDWNVTGWHRFALYTNGDFCTSDSLPTGLSFIITFFYATEV